MSYHNIYSTARSATNAQGKTAPAGYHYMPDGSLMSDAEHVRLYNTKIIRSFNLDTSNIKAAGESRRLTILGDKGAVFSLEIRNEDDSYYNFQTNLFQTTKTGLVNVSITGNKYTASVTFPKVTDADRYDFYLFSDINSNTRHVEYNEVRFPDNSIDINSTTGSNSNLVQKVIYQTLDVTLTLQGYAPNGTISGTAGTQAITTSRNASVITIPFSFIWTTGSSNTLAITKQPTSGDVMAFLTLTPGATPLDIEGEDIYPTVKSANKVVNGAVTSGANVTMDDDVGSLWAVGDRITGNAALDARTQSTAVTVTAVSVGGNDKIFTMSEAIAIADDETLNFSPRRNYRWSFDNIHRLTSGMRSVAGSFFETQPVIQEYLDQITVNEGESDEYKVDNVRIPALDTLGVPPVTTRNSTTNVETTVQTGNVTFSEQALLTFGGGANGKIFSYGESEINRLTGYDVEFTDLTVTLTPVTTTTTAASSNSKSVVIADRTGISDGISTVSGIGINPVISGTDTVNGAISGADQIVMDTAVARIMKVGDRVTGSGIPSTSTVTVKALNPDGDNVNEFSTSENITVADGVTLNFSSPVNPNPTVASGAGSVTGAGTITLSAPQTLESGRTLTFSGTSTVATIAGNIKINKAGNEDVVLRFDIEKFLTMQ